MKSQSQSQSFKLTPFKTLFLFGTALLFLLILPSVMADAEQYLIPNKGESMNNVLVYSIIVTLLLVITASYALISHSDKSSILINKMDEAQNKADALCAPRRMYTSPVYTKDFKTFNFNCFLKSPYYELPMEVTP